MRLLSKLRASCWEPTSCALPKHAGPGGDFFGGLLLPFAKNTAPRGGAFFCVFPVGLLLLRPRPRPQLPRMPGLPLLSEFELVGNRL